MENRIPTESFGRWERVRASPPFDYSNRVAANPATSVRFCSGLSTLEAQEFPAAGKDFGREAHGHFDLVVALEDVGFVR